MRFGDKAWDESQLDTLREETVNSVTKRMKAQAIHEENYQKAEARVLAEAKGKERDLRNVHLSRRQLVGTLNPPSSFVPLQTTVPTENKKPSPCLSASQRKPLQGRTPLNMKPDWYSKSQSESDATDTSAKEELQSRKAADRVARIALIDHLDKVLKDEKRSPLHMKKVSRVKKELQEYDSDAETTVGDEEFRQLVESEVPEAHYRKDEGLLTTFSRNENLKVITYKHIPLSSVDIQDHKNRIVEHSVRFESWKATSIKPTTPKASEATSTKLITQKATVGQKAERVYPRKGTTPTKCSNISVTHHSDTSSQVLIGKCPRLPNGND
ncbi:hypothetical protein BGX38DRAFT_1269277 [Terfezia claveryi]|nr:hypothetical protein BGX38DRAFT_1269277 [Terfezia claveryi]